MTKQYDSCWLGFDGFGALPEHHQIIKPFQENFVGIPFPYDLLRVEELIQNGGRSANNIAELLRHE